MILEGWHCSECRVFNGEAKEVLHICRSCGAARPKLISTPFAMALARSLVAGKHDPEIPKNLVFSYVGFAMLLAQYVNEQTVNYTFPPPQKSSAPDLAVDGTDESRAEQVNSQIQES
jgi:hypothetical protein